MKRALWTDGIDTFSAESAGKARRMQEEDWDDDQDECTFERVPDDKMVKVRWDGEAPEWVTSEPLASVENPEFVQPTICAPAHIWAKRESGMICSTEY